MKFFEEQEEQSTVKARIVQKYFSVWSKIVVGSAIQYGSGKIAYIDLYAGPGRYRDGAASTPLLVLEAAIENPKIAGSLVTLFNDQDSDNSGTLQAEIDKIKGIENLKYKPQVQCNPVGEDAADYFSKTEIIPSFTFFDPFGYKGLSLKLINGVIKDWGCDCVFFFNYNRINAGISNPVVKDHMAALFGAERTEELQNLVKGATPAQRQDVVLTGLTKALQEMGAEYVLPFRFKNFKGRLTHHLVFVSKHFKGYDVMKDIMSKESSTDDQGVGSFVYSPADESNPLLFELTRPLDDLREMLSEFSGKTLPFLKLYEQHSVGRAYLRRHYKEVLLKMENDDEIRVFSPTNKNRKLGYLADHLSIEFY